MGILCEIIEQKKKRLKDAKARVPVRDLRTKIGNSEQPGDFQSVIKRSPEEKIKLIAEIKSAPPSKEKQRGTKEQREQRTKGTSGTLPMFL